MADDGAVSVCVRVRPLIERENAELGGKESVAWKSEKCNISQVDGTKSFTFDRVFHPEESTADVYKEVADPIIKSAVQGYNGTIFAYGQTASGKTHTILGTKRAPGILPMAIEDVFKTICGVPDREFLLRISYMEIHNETIKDLLCSNIRKKKPLVVREDINRSIFVEDLIEEVVVSPEHVMSWLKNGEKNRHYGETKMNARSSRSHTIFRMVIESKEKSDASNSNCDGAVMVSHLNLVDLAGSERASQTGTDGIRLKEGCYINRSLFILAQVIKKLSDDQPGGFINYRDSKLTRILQNSLGGNAKTAIICTVTPVSLEETLSTLQFASTAKKMKNSPKVNEVLDDDALLKRYRREIEDLKRRLEEVSSDSHTRDEEKDQLAQLLEEKNSLQKQQEDRIRTLAEMVVTSSSFLREQELKARKKRRVTWTPGQINCNREIFSEDFPERTKRFKSSLSTLSEMEESVSSVFSEYDDHCLAVSATVPEEEWIPGPETSLIHKDFADSVILCETLAAERDTAVTKQQATQAELETLQVEKEQLSHEVRELTEKIETTEFMVLERETLKEHEMQLMHEISNLKAVIANAEGYSQDLQDNLKSKELQFKEREDKVTTLEKQIIELNNLLEESRKTGSGNKDVSPVGTSSQVMDEMKRSLSDAETVAMDAKKESAFLRSENLALKERMDQLLDDYNCMKKDTECYRSQLEASKVMYKNMQSDLQKELQYYFQENTKLTSLLDGKVPEGNQSSVELDGKILQLKNELDKALGENISLRKEVATLSGTCLKSDLEILHMEILEKSEMITSLTSEREILLSQVAEKNQRLTEMTNTLASKDLANAEAVRENDEAVQELKHHCQELRQELATVSEENKQMQDQLESLSGENLRLNAAINEMAEELSSKVQELQAKDLEVEKLLCMEEELSHVRQELNGMEQLKDQLKAWESKVEAGEAERLAIVQRLQGREEEISALAQGRDELKQMLEEVQRERDQIKDDIEDTVAMNIEAQNELRSSQHSLKQCQKDIKELQATLLQKESQTASIKEALETTIIEQKLQILKLTEDLEQATQEKNQLSTREALLEENGNQSEMEGLTEQLRILESKLEDKEREKLEMAKRLQDSDEERRSLVLERDDLKQKWDTVQTKKLKELSEGATSKLTNVEGLQARNTQEEELVIMKEELSQALQKLSEMEELRKQLKANEHGMEVNKVAAAQERHEHEEAIRSLVQEKDDLRHQRDALQQERDQAQEEMRATQSMLSSTNQELEVAERELFQMKAQLCSEAQQNQSEMERLTEQLKILESELEAKEREKMEMAERLQGGEEERKSLVLERDDLKQTCDAVQSEKEKLEELLEETTAKGLALQEQLENAKGSLKEYHSTAEELRGKNSRALKVQENLSQTTEQLKQKVMDTQAEMEKLLEKTKSQEQQVTRLESLIAEREEQLRKREAELIEEMAQLKEKLEQLTEKLSLQVTENNHLLAERKAQAESMQQLGMENLMLKKERDNIQQVMENTKAENNQLRHSCLENTEKFSETNAKLEQDLHVLKQQLEEARQEKTPENKEQDDLEKLQAKVSKITEALQKLPVIEKRYEYLGRVALTLKTEVIKEKELATKIIENVSCEKAKQIRRLQMEHELVGNCLHRLLNKLQENMVGNQEAFLESLSDTFEDLLIEKETLFLLTRLCKKKGEYYVNISNYTMELLGERRKQHELLTQIQSLKETCGNSHLAVSQELRIPELNQNLDFYVEQIWKDVSQMEEDVHNIEVMLQQLERNSRKVKEYSVPFDLQDFETGIKQDSERLLPTGRLLKPKAQALMETREELESRNANYCKETEATLKTCRERTRELLQAFNTLKEHQVPSGHADLILEEENYRLESKLKAQDQDMQGLKVKIQELENAANGARKGLLEKEQRISVLEMELKVRASKSEVLRLRTALEEKENCLTSTLMENQTLKAQLNKGAELYKEEIEDLKMQLAKADMALMKQSKWFDREMANAKALAEHKEEQLRKLREDLRRAQIEQDATIMPSQDIPQPPLSITCGGGSGIVQNMQMLVLKSEHVKLEREVSRLKKEHELVLKNELHLKEEVKKWKERALKMREQSRLMSEEPGLKSPRKTAPASLTVLPSSPKECSSRPALVLDCPTTFFDNSRLGTFNDVKPGGGVSPEKVSSEDRLKYWIAKTNQEGTPECKTQ